MIGQGTFGLHSGTGSPPSKVIAVAANAVPSTTTKLANMIFAFILPLQAARCGLQHGFYAKTSPFKAAQIVSSFVPYRWVGSNKEAQKFIHSKSSQKPVLCQANINVTWRAPQAEIQRMF